MFETVYWIISNCIIGSFGKLLASDSNGTIKCVSLNNLPC